MTLRRAVPHDIPALTAFLRQYETLSMFPLSNLAASGLDGPGRNDMRRWVAGAAEGFVGLTGAGMVLPQWPGAPDWAELQCPLAGHEVSGVLGPAEQVRPLIDALGLRHAPRRHDADEQGFSLGLAVLTFRDGKDFLTGLNPAPPGLVEGWRADYLCEVFATPPSEASRTAVDDINRWRKSKSHRLLWHHHEPVSLCGLNAALPDVIQVGGVFVPRPLRRRGHARQAVALMLDEARARGVLRAVLFAASDAAARAYRAFGFQPAGQIGLVLFDGLKKVPA